MPGLNLMRTRPQSGQIVPHGLVEQVFVDLGGEHGIGQFDFAYLLVIEIENVDFSHGYCFALRTTT